MSPRVSLKSALAQWPGRRWQAATAAAALTYLVVAVPTDLIDTPLFSREIPPHLVVLPGPGNYGRPDGPGRCHLRGPHAGVGP